MTESPTSLPELAPASLRRRATEALRTAIVEGAMQPGDRLKEVEISEQLGVSRSTVREALRQLEHEGLVAQSPYRATEVLGVSQEEVIEVLVPIRLTVESFAFRQAMTRLEPSDLERLSSLIAEMRKAAVAGDLDALAEEDVRFHELVIERSNQPHCLQIWRSIEPRVRAYFRRDAPAHHSLEELATEHEELLSALRSGDEQRLDETLGRHIHNHFGRNRGSDQ